MSDEERERHDEADEADERDTPPTSFAKAMFLGELPQDMVFPYPRPSETERAKVDGLVGTFRDYAERHYDPRAVEERGWVGDDTLAALGEMGLLGLYIDPKYGGQGLGQTGYCMTFEAIGQVDATLAVVLGVHQSIGAKGIHLYGTEAQKERFLPDLARGKKLAAFALTEPGAGSDAYHLETVAEPQPDGSVILRGEKRYIGNGSKDVIVTFARTPAGEHVACIVERGMKGFEVGDRYETMGLCGNDLRRLRYDGVRVPKDNILGEIGDGFDIATGVLDNGRLSLGTGTIGAAKRLLELATAHVTRREQFGHPLADFELVQQKLGWMVSYLYGLQSMVYLTTGMMDRGVRDVAIESAIAKVAGTEFIWYAANRVFQLAGGEAYLRSAPYEKILRDIRVFPVFEGANDVLRAFIALSGLKEVGEEIGALGALDVKRPLASLGVLWEYAADRARRTLRPAELTRAHPALADLTGPVADGVSRLRGVSEALLMKHGDAIHEPQGQLKRVAHAAMDLYAQVATISRVSDVLERADGDVEHERFLAETFCTRAAGRVGRWLGQVDDNDDERMHAIAQHALKQGGYTHSI